MKVGTKSILFGAHQFMIHPVFVAYAWWRLYGFPLDPRLWIAFFVHDLGYWGMPNMDGPEGELHPYFAGDLMAFCFGQKWFRFCVNHSRFLAAKREQSPSRLCMADKLAVALEPWWFYLPRAILTGEVKEYMSIVKTRHKEEPLTDRTRVEWIKSVKVYLESWAYEHRNEADS